jgi:hypothetical protein
LNDLFVEELALLMIEVLQARAARNDFVPICIATIKEGLSRVAAHLHYVPAYRVTWDPSAA